MMHRKIAHSTPLLIILFLPTLIYGHGYMKTPRSRNFVAFSDGRDWPLEENNPKKDYCPHCLNLGGSLATCGLHNSFNYDYPKNALDGPMHANPQAVYTEGDIITVDVVLTAHHKGHFVLKACPINEFEVATQDCFNQHPLEFEEDMLYGAPGDANHPERGYIAPSTFPGIIMDTSGVNGYLYTHKYKLPEGLTGDLVLLQWTYYTANSCVYEGYDQYNWPDSSWDPNLAVCGNISSDGTGAPERFWNCAEIAIVSDGPVPPTTPAPTNSPVSPSPIISPVSAPVTPPVAAPTSATCGSGTVGNGICADGLCCSQWGWCGDTAEHCGTNTPPPMPVSPPPPSPPTPPSTAGDDSRLVAYLGNWQPCPTPAQVEKYTHIVIAFAVSYTWNPSKNVCSNTCDITTPPICNNAPNQALVNQWQQAGKKVLLGFGGAGMGGSWSSDVNDCWEYCFGREQQVVNQLVEITNNLGLDGVDVDYEYFYEDNQNGSGFAKGAEAQRFLVEVTEGLRNSLPSGSIITHAPMDSDIVQGKAYFDILQDIASNLDFLMPQYYNGVTRPISDGLAGSGVGSMSTISHYNALVNDVFDGDATKVVFGFCISDCSGTASNADGNQAAIIMDDLRTYYYCNGGAFFWVAHHDVNGAWSNYVSQETQITAGCSSGPTDPPITVSPTTTPPTVAPTTTPSSAPVAVTNPPTSTVTSNPTPHPTQRPNRNPTLNPTPNPTSAPTDAPVASPVTSPSEPCCPPGETGLRDFNSCSKYYHCVNGNVVGAPLACPVGTLFDKGLQICNWSYQVQCANSSCGPPAPTEAPVASPSEPCCPVGYSGLRAHDSCSKYYHCVNGGVIGAPMPCPAGTLFDETYQYCNWANQVQCSSSPCSRRLRGVQQQIS